MDNFITEPKTFIQYSIFSKKGLKLLNNKLKKYRYSLDSIRNKNFDKNLTYNKSFKNP